jgi:hypothetical protein
MRTKLSSDTELRIISCLLFLIDLKHDDLFKTVIKCVKWFLQLECKMNNRNITGIQHVYITQFYENVPT